MEDKIKLILSTTDEFGRLFQVIPFISMDMSAEMIKMELQRSHEKLEFKIKNAEKDLVNYVKYGNRGYGNGGKTT